MASRTSKLPLPPSSTKKEVASRPSPKPNDGRPVDSESDSESASESESASASASDNADTIGLSPVLAADIAASVVADDMDLDIGAAASAARDLRALAHTPELQTVQPGQSLEGQARRNGRPGPNVQQAQGPDGQRSPGTPGHVPPFDWDEFQARYEQALNDMNGQEKELLEDFDRLVNYFNVWASAASAHDDERAVKRLQTRERYVRIAEQSLGQRKQHLTEVVRAFQSALALLSQT